MQVQISAIRTLINGSPSSDLTIVVILKKNYKYFRISCGLIQVPDTYKYLVAIRIAIPNNVCSNSPCKMPTSSPLDSAHAP